MILEQERAALVALYNSTNGDNWSDKSGWLGVPGTEGTWNGITVVADHVTKIELPQNQLARVSYL
jgi:hypothetical protein